MTIGVAWGGLLANFAAGAFLVFLRPFKVGDSERQAFPRRSLPMPSLARGRVRSTWSRDDTTRAKAGPPDVALHSAATALGWAVGP